MTFADSNRASIRVIRELPTEWAKTPSSGSTRDIRFTSSNLVANKETAVSDEIRADRMVSSIIETGATSSGELNFEFSAGSHDEFLAAFVLGGWSRPMTFDYFKGTAVSWTANNTITITGVDATGYFTVGRRIKTEGFNSKANNGYRTVSAVSYAGNNTTITTTEAGASPESGSVFSKVMDANDAIIMNNNKISVTMGGISSGGTNAFAPVIAANQLKVGQRIFLDFEASAANFDSYTVTFTGAGANGDTLTVSDGRDTRSYVLGTDLGVGANASGTASMFAAILNRDGARGDLAVKAIAAAGVVTVLILTNDAQSSVADTVDTGSEIAVSAKIPASAPNNRGYFTITALSDDALGLTPRLTAQAAGTPCTIKGSMLRNPGEVENITSQSFTMETAFNDVTQHFLMKGMRVGTYSLDVSSGSIVTGSMSFKGEETTTSTASTLKKAPYKVLDSTATEVVNATANVGNLVKDGAALSTAVQSITMEGDASLRDQMAVGSKFPSGIGTGRFNLTGTITAYFQDLTLYNDFINHATTSISWSFTDTDHNTYFFTIPALKITSDPISPEGIDQDVLENMEWTAFRDAATECMIQVDRFSSNKPL